MYKGVHCGCICARRFFFFFFLLLCFSFFNTYVLVQNVSVPKDLSDRIQIAVDKGLKYLLNSQSKSGKIGYTYYIGSSSLAGLAFFAAGYTPSSGKFGISIEKIARFLIKNQRKTGFITEYTNTSRFHGHSYALIFLTYVYSELRDDSLLLDRGVLRRAIRKAIAILEASQIKSGQDIGGFPYTPGEQMAENSTVVCCVSALRSAKDAGFKVKASVIRKGVEYIRRCANPDGSFSYNVSSRGGTPIMTVNGMMNLIFYGSWEDEKLIKKGFENVKPLYKKGDLFQGWDMEYYGTFYAALALYYLDEALWNEWFQRIATLLVNSQRVDGSWSSSTYGVATPFALLILQLPKKILPLFVK